MEKKLKIWEQIGIIGFLLATLFIFVAGPIVFFFYFEKFFSINFYILVVFKILIAIILFYIYIKLLIFMPTKSALTEKQFQELSKEKKKYKIKTEKKENRIPIASTKKLKSLLREGEELNKKYYKGTVFFDSFMGFILFSLIFGFFYISKPIWAIKRIIFVTKDCIKTKKLGNKCKFGWRKILDVNNGNYVYYAFPLPQPKAPWEK